MKEELQPSVTKLELRTAYGPVYRDVLNTPPRDCTEDEIPVIDLAGIFSSNFADRKAVAEQVKAAGTNTGFFYVRNHGIDTQKIESAQKQLLEFFKQPLDEKLKLNKKQSKYFNGYNPPNSSVINKSEKVDHREGFSWRYSPEYDPDSPAPISALSENQQSWIRGEEFVWEKTAHLPDFKDDCLAYWQACLSLARKLVRIFALALDLPESYFDSRVTRPGADGVFNYYPAATSQEIESNAIGLGSHTDLQLFTLLWQDQNGGLQVLKKEGQWIRAKPVPNTFVVNIGDFMMRLSNDYFKSTVHRVYNRSGAERISMPFFFGLNFDCVEGVIPTCVKPGQKAKYEPISCGDWCQLRFQLEADEFAKRKVDEEAVVGRYPVAPSALVVAA